MNQEDPTPHLLKIIQSGDRNGLRDWLRQGGDPNTTLAGGDRLIHIAADKFETWAVKLLAKAGADLEALDHQGLTALGIAAEWSVPHLIKVLVACGAKIETQDKQGLTAMERAIHLSKADSILCLMDLGAKFKPEDVGDVWANVSSQIDAERLLDVGMGVREYDEEARSALWWAAHHGYPRVCKRLMAMGLDPNQPDVNDQTPLMEAAECGCTTAVRVLLAGGGNPDLKNGYRNTAKDLAAEHEHQAVLREFARHDRKQLAQQVKQAPRRATHKRSM